MSDPQFSLLPRLINGSVAATVGAASVFPLDLVKTRLQNQAIGPNGEKQYSSMFDCFMKTLNQEGARGLYRGLAVNLSLVGLEKGVKLGSNDYFRHFLSSENTRLSLFRQALAGAGAGVIQILVSTPMELLKIQIQDSGRVAMAAVADGRPAEKVSGLGIAAQLIKEKGIFGLYRGFIPTAYRDISFAMVYFPFYAYLQDKCPVGPDGEPQLYWHLLCGLLSGATCAWLSTPFDVIKTKLQAIAKSEGQRQYTGIFDCFAHTWKTEGLPALFRGGACRIIVIAPLYAITQMVYYVGLAEKILGIETQKSVK